MSLVVAEAEFLEPGADELAEARERRSTEAPERIVLQIDAADFAPGLIEEPKCVFESLGADRGALLEMSTLAGCGPCASVGSTASYCPRP